MWRDRTLLIAAGFAAVILALGLALVVFSWLDDRRGPAPRPPAAIGAAARMVPPHAEELRVPLGFSFEQEPDELGQAERTQVRVGYLIAGPGASLRSSRTLDLDGAAGRLQVPGHFVAQLAADGHPASLTVAVPPRPEFPFVGGTTYPAYPFDLDTADQRQAVTVPLRRARFGPPLRVRLISSIDGRPLAGVSPRLRYGVDGLRVDALEAATDADGLAELPLPSEGEQWLALDATHLGSDAPPDWIAHVVEDRPITAEMREAARRGEVVTVTTDPPMFVVRVLREDAQGQRVLDPEARGDVVVTGRRGTVGGRGGSMSWAWPTTLHAGRMAIYGEADNRPAPEASRNFGDVYFEFELQSEAWEGWELVDGHTYTPPERPPEGEPPVHRLVIRATR